MIKVVSTAFLVCLFTISSSAEITSLRGSSSSSCHSYKSKDECIGSSDGDTDEVCFWCECAAIPSECLTEGEAKRAPPGVFACSSTFTEDEDGEAEWVDSEYRYDNSEDKKAASAETVSNAFDFVEGLTHTLTDGPVDGDLCDPSSLSLSGYMDVKGSKFDTNQDKHLFFWFFEKRNAALDNDDKATPMILWLTGGPGCSSTLALLTENGPCSVDKEDATKTNINPFSWTETAHVLWLDQPAGVGYSYAKSADDKNEEMVGEDAYYFLQSFYKAHPEYQSSPLYVVGESYGGHYAPAIAHRIFVGNQNLDNDSNESKLLKIPLAGLGIGNGLTKPEEQYKWYPEMAYNNSHHMQVISKQTYQAMKMAIPQCVTLIKSCNAGNSFINNVACQTAFITCNTALTTPYQLTGLNPYDIRKECGDHPLCYDFDNVEKFLNLPETRDALHVSPSAPRKWASCNYIINMAFRGDWMKDFSPFVADLLDSGTVRVLIYAGDVDFICNYLGNRAWVLGLDWSSGSNFRSADDHDWNDGSGLARTYGDLTFLQVYDAGHMVPSDQPQVALDMITTFVTGGDF